jgi:hypothetical protein
MSKDYERLCVTGEALVYVAMTRLMVRWLARAYDFSDSLRSCLLGNPYTASRILMR